MRALSPAALLAAWEAGHGQHPLDRALTLLAAADPAATRAELAALPLAERDRRLLRAHAAAAGPELAACAECPACAERLELALDVDELAARDAAPAGAVHEARGGGVAMRFRLPDSRDLAAAARCHGVAAARRLLAARCVVEARDEGGEPAGELPEAAVDALAARMEEVAPETDVSLAMRCPACGAEWESPLDVAAFAWEQAAARARRLLREVDALARAYHWSEGEILALSSDRRHAYLELAAP